MELSGTALKGSLASSKLIIDTHYKHAYSHRMYSSYRTDNSGQGSAEVPTVTSSLSIHYLCSQSQKYSRTLSVAKKLFGNDNTGCTQTNFF